MADNLAKAGLSFRRADRSTPGTGTLMRMRGGAISKGQLVRIDYTSSDDQINTDTETIDFGTAAGSSSVFASVIKVAALSTYETIGVALESAVENAMVRVEFGQGGTPVIVEGMCGATVTIGQPLAAATDGQLDPATTTVNGQVVARALEGGSTNDLIRILFYGNGGVGFLEDAT